MKNEELIALQLRMTELAEKIRQVRHASEKTPLEQEYIRVGIAIRKLLKGKK